MNVNVLHGLWHGVSFWRRSKAENKKYSLMQTAVRGVPGPSRSTPLHASLTEPGAPHAGQSRVQPQAPVV